MASPDLIATFSATATGTTALSTGAFTVAAGDLIVVKCAASGTITFNTPTASGLTFTNQVTTATPPKAMVFTAVCPGADTITVTAGTATSGRHNFVVQQWRNAALDASPATLNDASGSAPNVSVTTESTDEVITWIVADNNEVTASAPAYRAAGGTAVEDAKQRFSGAYTYWSAYNHSTGAAGSKAVGFTSPTGLAGFLAGICIQRSSSTTVVEATTSTTWDTAAIVTDTTSTTWDTAAIVTDTTGTTWDTYAVMATDTTSTTWDVFSVVTDTTSTTWDTAAIVTDTTSTTWDTAAIVTDTTSTTWDTYAPVLATTSTTWDVFGLDTDINVVIGPSRLGTSVLSSAVLERVSAGPSRQFLTVADTRTGLDVADSTTPDPVTVTGTRTTWEVGDNRTGLDTGPNRTERD